MFGCKAYSSRSTATAAHSVAGRRRPLYALLNSQLAIVDTGSRRHTRSASVTRQLSSRRVATLASQSVRRQCETHSPFALAPSGSQ